MSATLLKRVVDGMPVAREEARALIEAFAAGEVGNEVMAAALTALAIRGETPAVLAGFVDALRGLMVPVALEGLPAMDVCGTGGDGQGTVNLSTAAGLVVAACGVPVAKHGNHAVSGSVGSADVLLELGIRVQSSIDFSRQCLLETGFGFFYAPAHHPLFARLGPVRRALGFRTAFNLLGPLLNPAGVRRQVIGVANPAAMAVLGDVLRMLKAERVLLVHTPGPYDEVSLTAPAEALLVSEGQLERLTFEPRDFGCDPLEPSELRGGDAAFNARALESLAQGARSGLRQAVCANAAVALLVAGCVRTVREGMERAEAALDAGAVGRLLNDLRARSQEESHGLAG